MERRYFGGVENEVLKMQTFARHIASEVWFSTHICYIKRQEKSPSTSDHLT